MGEGPNQPPATFPMGNIGSILLEIAEHARMGLVVCALEEGNATAVYVNNAAVSIFGRPRDELMHTNLMDFIAEDQRENSIDFARRVLQGQPTGALLETAFVQPSGRRIPVDISFASVAQGRKLLTVNVVFDISERKTLEAQLARADRLTAMGTLAAGVAHEINNPLSFMTLQLETLGRLVEQFVTDDAAREKAGALVSEVLSGTKRVASIVRDLRTFSREDDDEEVPVDVWRVIESAAQLVAHRLQDRARLDIEPSELPAVRASALRLEQVFVNLFVNAIHAFPAAAPRNVVRVRGGPLEGGGIYIEVADNGSGIPADVLERVFDPFFTTKPLGHGTGLGLAICHGIVHRLGGELTVKSSVGVGTTFRVTLPASRVATRGPSARPEPAADASRRERVLVIDDEPAIGESIQYLLSDHYEVDVVTNGESALARVHEGNAYDLVLCDLMMVGLSGVDVYERLAIEQPGLEESIAFMTGGAVTEHARHFLARIPNVCIHKPFSVDALERALRTVKRATVSDRRT